MSKVVYVYDGNEVVLTGRKARKKAGRRVVEVYEIKPNTPTMDSASFCKWVRMIDLYEIMENEE